MADSDMLRAAEAEVIRLEAELEATPAYQKLQLAKAVVSLYREVPTARFLEGGKEVRPARAVGRLYFPGPLTTKTAKIEAAAAEYLKSKGARAPASELLPAVEKAGIEIGGKEPIKALSAYLSSSRAFNNQRELGGYGLSEWGNSRGPDLLNESFME
jgi:hypothetical protein